MRKTITIPSILFLLCIISLIPKQIQAQSTITRDTMIVAAMELIKATNYCVLVTVDSMGQPQARTMNPFPVNDNLTIWFATSRTSRKTEEIKKNPKVCVYFADHINATGYVNITGSAEVIDDKNLLINMKRKYWEGIPNWQNTFVLIKITPETLEVINYKHNLNNDPDTFKAPSIKL
jgi:general stress protein 26